MTSGPSIVFGAVAIGRNEGERLKQCLNSLSAAAKLVYVDSGSSDGSVAWARRMGIDVIELDLTLPFTAARARNAGFRRLLHLSPALSYVQFIDGDCELNSDWPKAALSFLSSRPNVGAVFGRRRERYPERSIYNQMCDREWDVPIGEASSCGGDVFMCVQAFESAGGYRDELIAGEEPELCVRLRRAGWKIWRLDNEMTLHDAAMLHFKQWWRRQTRSGYAFAQGAALHGRSPDRHWVRESRRALFWGLFLPILLIGLLLAFGWWVVPLFLIYLLQIFRRARHMPGDLLSRLHFSFFEQLTRFPEAIGQLKFWRNRMHGRHGQLIEYK
jgi:glycosyltransferase involved in cell wall biosynthesis